MSKKTAFLVAWALVQLLGSIPEAPPLAQMPLYATAYSWRLGGINCNGDCRDVATGLLTSDELLGRSAACLTDWAKIGTTIRITLPDGSQWYCIDVFGDPINREPRLIDHPVYGLVWVVRVDFAVEDPWSFEHNQELIYNWEIEWRPVSELTGK